MTAMEEASSRLERPVTLADIIDADSLERVCGTFSRLYGTHVRVTDAAGVPLAQEPAGDQALQHADAAFCLRLKDALSFECEGCGRLDRGLPKEDRASTARCGLRFRVLRIAHQGQLLGWLQFGPYRPEGVVDLPTDVRSLCASAEGSETPRLDEALNDAFAAIPSIGESAAVSGADAAREVLGVIVQTGYARHLTSQIHIAAIQDAYDELSEKNRRLADSVEKLKDLDKLKSSFLATVSHELRTPLTSVIGYSEMLIEGLAGPLNQEQGDYVKTILDKGEHLLKLINEVLEVSRIESGVVQLSLEQFDVSDLVRQVADAMMPQARRKSLSLTYQSMDALRPLVADRTKTRQVLINLLNNAIKFTHAGGSVLIEARNGHLECRGRKLPSVDVHVRDNGIGVPPGSREQIFEAFFQVDSSSTRVYGGTGLGLSIVKHFVEAHGGRVWVEPSGSADGSVFVVQFPVVPPPHLRSRHLVGA